MTTRRRTQAERRADTIRRLVQATIEAIHDVGYACTTVKEITTRAALSQGALFRHFPTRLDLIVAAAEEVARRHAEAFQAEIKGSVDPFEAAIRATRARCHSPINTVWHELILACRTDPTLRAAVQPAAARYKATIEQLAGSVLGRALPSPDAKAAAWFVIHCFDGEAFGGLMLGDPEGAERRISWLTEMMQRQLSARPDDP